MVMLMFDFELDGMQFLKQMLLMEVYKTNPRLLQIFNIFEKYNLDVMSGTAMMLEIAAVMGAVEQSEEGDEE